MNMLLSALILVLALAAPCPAQGQGKTRSEMPDLVLAGPTDRAAADYLGLAGESKTIRLSDIKAELALIEVFSMYCPHCQAEAPEVNELHALILASPHKARLKILGIGAGNSEYEVNYFRKTYNVAFPLFPDPDYVVHKALGEVGTPYFILARLAPKDGRLEVLFTHEGEFKGARALFDALLAKSGLNNQGR
ncbi:MAG: TlpA disulfide reductase family protein [Desulfovibrionaceae bacterium]|nr:TlpA family protein disulfide reductase [Desulfovibrionaceae bacterium]MDD4951687.1 TlpA disulfide reductase family protein [Desulfovibrionaceae bacterium]